MVVLDDNQKNNVTEQDIIDWSKGQLAAFGYPRIVRFAEILPKTASGKILWRNLQDEANRQAR